MKLISSSEFHPWNIFFFLVETNFILWKYFSIILKYFFQFRASKITFSTVRNQKERERERELEIFLHFRTQFFALCKHQTLVNFGNLRSAKKYTTFAALAERNVDSGAKPTFHKLLRYWRKGTMAELVWKRWEQIRKRISRVCAVVCETSNSASFSLRTNDWGERKRTLKFADCMRSLRRITVYRIVR